MEEGIFLPFQMTMRLFVCGWCAKLPLMAARVDLFTWSMYESKMCILDRDSGECFAFWARVLCGAILKKKKSDFFCERRFFSSFDTEIFLNQQTQAGQNRRAKKNERNALLLLLLFFFLLFFASSSFFFPPSPRCLFIRRRKKKNGRRRVWWTKKTRVSFFSRIDEEKEEEENFVVVVVAPPTPSPHLLPLHFRRRRPFRRRPRAFDKKSITVVEIVFESFHKPPPKQWFRSRTYLRSKSGRKHQRGILTRRVDRVEQSNVF